MTKLQRDEIHLLSKHSNWSEKSVQESLDKNVYSTPSEWLKFLKLFLLSIGVCFTISGILFFFAYNWEDLHKFVKLGIVEFLLVCSISLSIVPKLSQEVKNVMLLASTVLVGVLFAVFGQIYQSGANAYDFFLGWTMAVTLWVVISNFAPLWLFFVVLINTTFILYTQQVVTNWDSITILTILVSINFCLLLIGKLHGFLIKSLTTPNWFSHTLALGIISYVTIGLCIAIWKDFNSTTILFLVVSLLMYSLGIWESFHLKQLFHLAIIPFSLIIVISTLCIKILDNNAAFIIISLLVIMGTTLSIKNLISLQKKWTNE